MSGREFTEARWLVGRLVAALPTEAWRHSGIGALQTYVREGDTDELRVHVWHPSLVRRGIRASGDVHDHRFDLDSAVLLGEIDHVEHEPVEVFDHGGFWSAGLNHRTYQESSLWQMHEVVHARAAAVLVGSHHLPRPALPERYAVRTSGFTVSAGHRYTFPRRAFHATRVGGLAVTLVRKTNQEAEPPARVLSPVGVPVVHAFEEPMLASEWTHVLREASEALLR